MLMEILETIAVIIVIILLLFWKPILRWLFSSKKEVKQQQYQAYRPQQQIDTTGGPSGGIPCPQCGNPGQFYEEYSDHYCWNCKDYFQNL